MNELHHSKHPHEGHDHGTVHRGRRPYWKHAHRDWRFWVAVFFVFGALIVYVMSDDLALVPRSHPRQQHSGSERRAGK